MQNLAILGATGSIGDSTLAVVRQHSDRFNVSCMTAQQNWQKLAELAKEFSPELVVIGDETHYLDLKSALSGLKIEVEAGEKALIEAAKYKVDKLMLAIVGIAGLRPAMAAAKAGQSILIANKESLVCGGKFLLNSVAHNGGNLVPVDSEHNAVAQIYDDVRVQDVAKVTITASGGPFWEWEKARIAQAVAKNAIAHPNWSMGAKISVDSATLMNKGLELIEAARLFGDAADKLDVLVHRQSVVHGLVEYVDGTTKAVMSPPNMQSPIAVAMGWGEDRLAVDLPRLDLSTIGKLTFENVDESRFPCFKLAKSALDDGLEACVVLNAANEVAVAAYLRGEIGFYDIAHRVEEALAQFSTESVRDLEGVFELDAAVRESDIGMKFE